jgi:hypothetical protein
MLDNGSIVPNKFIRGVGLGVILNSFYKVAPAHLRVTSKKCYMSDTAWIHYVHCKKPNCPWKARITGDFSSFSIMRSEDGKTVPVVRNEFTKCEVLGGELYACRHDDSIVKAEKLNSGKIMLLTCTYVVSITY